MGPNRSDVLHSLSGNLSTWKAKALPSRKDFIFTMRTTNHWSPNQVGGCGMLCHLSSCANSLSRQCSLQDLA